MIGQMFIRVQQPIARVLGISRQYTSLHNRKVTKNNRKECLLDTLFGQKK
jgi:hypothetical protein